MLSNLVYLFDLSDFALEVANAIFRKIIWAPLTIKNSVVIFDQRFVGEGIYCCDV